MVVERRKRTPPQIAKLWGCSIKKVVWFIRSGQLRAVNLASNPTGRPRYVIDLADIEAFEIARQVVPDGGASTTRKLRRRAAKGVKEFF